MTMTALVLSAALTGAACTQEVNRESAALLARMDITELPDQALKDQSVERYMRILQREPCDWDAIYPLASRFYELGYKRQAAQAYLYFPHKCTRSNVALSRAADIFLQLSDFDAATKTVDELIADSPDYPDYHYQRGQTYEAARRFDEAVDAYETTIALTDDIATLNGGVFRRTVNAYAELGKYCEAITPLQTWIGIDPGMNDTADVRSMIDRYRRAGNCSAAYASGKGAFRAKATGDVILVKASINGVVGKFIVDTGASLLSVTRDFAKRANMNVLEKSTIRLQTANGVVTAKRSLADTVALGKVSANGVGAVVMTESDNPLGNQIDGLLGQSFLSRFHVTLTKRELKIEVRGE